MQIFRNFIPATVLITILSFGFPVTAQPEGESVTAKVVGVHDGDTITVLTPLMEQIKVRLGEIDAPELKQPFGQKSKQMLSDMIFDKEVTLIKTDRDRYGRTVGRVYVEEEDINRAMAAQGGAWAYLQYLTDNSVLEAQTDARAAKIGLWALQADQVIPPWEWRKAQKADYADPEPIKSVTPAPAPSRDPDLWEPLPEQYPYARSESAFASPSPAQASPHTAHPPAAPESSNQTCTKRCSKGKPCGDGCISQDKTCTKPPGKAC